MIQDEAVVHEMELPASAESVFAMFVNAELLVRWIGLSAEIEAREGGRFRFEVMPGQYCEGSFVTVEPPDRLVFTWGWTEPDMGVPPGSTTVEVTLTAIDSGHTRLRLVHTGLDGNESRRLHDDGWSRFMDRLLAVITGKPVPEYPSETPDERLSAITLEDRR